MLAGLPEVGEVVGIDPSALFVEQARARVRGIANLTFVHADGRDLPFDDASFDAVVCHTVLCHVPEPQDVLAEAHRVTAAGGLLAVFDGDYATTTVATCDHDPLPACADAAMAAYVHDPRLVRRLPTLVCDAGYDLVRLRSHGYAETDALKAEARRRADEGAFFGHIAYASLIASRATCPAARR